MLCVLMRIASLYIYNRDLYTLQLTTYKTGKSVQQMDSNLFYFRVGVGGEAGAEAEVEVEVKVEVEAEVEAAASQRMHSR